MDTEDKFLITEVIAKYAAAIDGKDFELFSTCFQQNVEVLRNGDNTTAIKGLDDWISYVKESVGKCKFTHHLLSIPLIKKDGQLAKVRTNFKLFTRYIEPEGEIAEIIELVQNNYEELTIGSYPFFRPPDIGSNIVLRSLDELIIISATNELVEKLKKNKIPYEFD